MIKEITLPSEPDAARGKDMHNVLFVGDPDMGELNHMEAGEFSALWDACIPKFTGTTGEIIVFGTSGTAFGKAESPNQEEVFELFENIMIDGQ
jgi:hypothetical protein